MQTFRDSSDTGLSVSAARHLRLVSICDALRTLGIAHFSHGNNREFQFILCDKQFLRLFSGRQPPGGSDLSLGPVQGRGSGTVVVDPASVSAGAAGQVVAAVIAGQPVSISIPGRGLSFGIISKLSGKALDFNVRYRWRCHSAEGLHMDSRPAVGVDPRRGWLLLHPQRSEQEHAGYRRFFRGQRDPHQSVDFDGTDDQKWQVVSVGDHTTASSTS